MTAHYLGKGLALALAFVGVRLSASAESQSPFIVHEWGTFTCVSGSDGVLLTGLEVEEHALPAFVLGHGRPAAGMKAWPWPVTGVTVKMETPVLYFYSDVPRAVTVDVGFNGGSISQWYQERIGGERVAAPAMGPQGPVPRDFSRGYGGSARWRVDVLAPSDPVALSAPASLETRQWARARVADANRVRGPKGEIEGFIFYRGLGNFSLPLTVTATDHSVSVANAGPDQIPFAFVYERTPRASRVWWGGPIPAGERQEVVSSRSESLRADEVIRTRFAAELERAGLTGDEARAMLATWQESYFDRPGLRVFWIVPRAFTERVLPIAITPAPDRIERVLVGRTEVLTPAFESELQAGFALEEGKQWAADRYFLAYRERAGRLQSAVAQAPSAP